MRDLSGAQAITQYFNDEEQTLVKSSMAAFTSVGTKLRSTLRVCHLQIRSIFETECTSQEWNNCSIN
jgi:hypothetical protein